MKIIKKKERIFENETIIIEFAPFNQSPNVLSSMRVSYACHTHLRALYLWSGDIWNFLKMKIGWLNLDF
jgi:hypothetical protein